MTKDRPPTKYELALHRTRTLLRLGKVDFRRVHRVARKLVNAKWQEVWPKLRHHTDDDRAPDPLTA